MPEKLEAGEIYRGPCGVLKDSAWLSAETISAEKDTVVQIQNVIRRREVKFKSETKKGYGSLRFVGAERELGLNSTHIKVLKALFGPMTDKWEKQWVSLYVDPNVNAFGQIVSAIRIRAKRIDPPKPGVAKVTAEQLDRPLTQEEMDATDAKQNALGGSR